MRPKRPAQAEAQPVDHDRPVERSPQAHAAYARALELDPRMAGADADAYMALSDFAAELRAKGEGGPGAVYRPTPDSPGENIRRQAVPGRPDLEFVRGNGVGGCSYIVISRVKEQPVKGYVQRTSWADEEVDQSESVEQSVSVHRTR
jgi:hypothetical protein